MVVCGINLVFPNYSVEETNTIPLARYTQPLVANELADSSGSCIFKSSRFEPRSRHTSMPRIKTTRLSLLAGVPAAVRQTIPRVHQQDFWYGETTRLEKQANRCSRVSTVECQLLRTPCGSPRGRITGLLGSGSGVGNPIQDFRTFYCVPRID
jgi:hypothetical protein